MARRTVIIDGAVEEGLLDEEDVILLPPMPTKASLKRGVTAFREAAVAPVTINPPTGLPLDLMPELISAAELYFGDVVLGLTEVQKLVIINYLRLCNPSRAAAGVGVPVTDHRRWMRENYHYREAMEAADEVITDLIEEVGIRQGLMGSERLLIALLKGRRHARYNPIAAAKNPNDGPQSWADLSKTLGEEDEDDE